MSDRSDSPSIIESSRTPREDNEQRAKIFAALSDPTRLRIVEILAEQEELSGSEIANRLGISLALFCHHSRTLAEAGVIQQRREGQTKYNSLNRDLLKACLTSFGV
jgi:DNA-binding transcriptional ArsR family regulator